MSRNPIFRILLPCFLLLLFVSDADSKRAANSKNMRIGVLAKRGPARCQEKWGPTARYLTAKLPRKPFSN